MHCFIIFPFFSTTDCNKYIYITAPTLADTSINNALTTQYNKSTPNIYIYIFIYLFLYIYMIPNIYEYISLYIYIYKITTVSVTDTMVKTLWPPSSTEKQQTYIQKCVFIYIYTNICIRKAFSLTDTSVKIALMPQYNRSTPYIYMQIYIFYICTHYRIYIQIYI